MLSPLAAVFELQPWMKYLMKLNKKTFRENALQLIFWQSCQNFPFGWPAGFSPSIAIISEAFLKFPDFLRS